MIIIELPVVFAKNAVEIDKAIKAGMQEPETIEEIEKTTFYIPVTDLMRVTPHTEEGRTFISFPMLQTHFTIDADYETVNGILRDKLKNLK